MTLSPTTSALLRNNTTLVFYFSEVHGRGREKETFKENCKVHPGKTSFSQVTYNFSSIVGNYSPWVSKNEMTQGKVTSYHYYQVINSTIS